MAAKYNVCVPRKYKDGQGVEKIHFWPVGKMVPMQERDGYKLFLYTRVLPTDELVLWPDERNTRPSSSNAPGAPEIPDDDIPF